MNTVCFTGHRPNKLNGYNVKDNKELLWKIHDMVIDLIKNRDVDTFINGAALGVDLWSAKIIIGLKKEYPNIKLITALPCRNHPSKWNKESQELWQEVCDSSNEVVLVTDDDYRPYLMQVRNEWMVDKSNIVLAVWDGSKGGTSNCVNYAEKTDKEIIKITP